MCVEQVDIAFAPFIERFEIAFSEIRGYDITAGRPKLSQWIEVTLFHDNRVKQFRSLFGIIFVLSSDRSCMRK